MSKKQHQQRMNKVVNFIENHLDDTLNMQILISLSCYSEFHFHRLFRSYVGESVYGYRKRLLLERSVKQLLHSTETITEIAFNCGYDNQASFNKAFKNQYSYSPSQVRQLEVSLQKQTLNHNIERQVEMKPIIKNINDIHVVCAREIGSYAQAAPKAWGRVMKYGYSNRLMTKEVRLIGITHDDPQITDAQQIRYDACLDLNTDISVEDNLSKHTITGGKYAVFLHKGAYEGLQQAYSYIFNEWLPDSEFNIKQNEPCFEVYLNRDPRKTKPENLKTEIHIPLG
jgi:AraC family transcriptional regulator